MRNVCQSAFFSDLLQFVLDGINNAIRINDRAVLIKGDKLIAAGAEDLVQVVTVRHDELFGTIRTDNIHHLPLFPSTIRTRTLSLPAREALASKPPQFLISLCIRWHRVIGPVRTVA